MSLPVLKILWAPTNAAHYDHLHVEGDPKVEGTLADCSSTWTPAVRQIWEALDEQFPGWTTLGVFNCRNIANTSIPSQHAFSNAIDIGPYYGVEEQQKFYDFLTGEDEMTPEQEAVLNAILDAKAELDPGADVYPWVKNRIVKDLRTHVTNHDQEHDHDGRYLKGVKGTK